MSRAVDRGPWSARAGRPEDDPAGLPQYQGLRLFQFHTSGMINNGPDFLVGVQPSGTSWRVTEVGPDTPSTGAMSAECAAAAIGNPTTGPSS